MFDKTICNTSKGTIKQSIMFVPTAIVYAKYDKIIIKTSLI